MARTGKKIHPMRRLLPLAAVLTGLLWAGNFTVGRTEMTLTARRLPRAFDGFRIALLTDLHGRTFGPDNDWLIAQVQKAQPDLIALSGDIADEHTDLEELSALLVRLCAIAPCYYVTGNHEWRMENRKEWFAQLASCGVVRLENSFVTLTRGEAEVILAGVDDPNGPADQKTPGQLMREIRAAAPEAYTILLCHRNDQLARMAELGVDLVLSGHAHGGVVRLPFVGAVFGTHYELFPDDTEGVCRLGKTAMVVSRGLGGSRRIPLRIGNRPEIPVVVLTCG